MMAKSFIVYDNKSGKTVASFDSKQAADEYVKKHDPQWKRLNIDVKTPSKHLVW